jgi:hypothetical protein
MSEFPKIEIKTIGEAPSLFTEVLIDGHKISGVRSVKYENSVADKIPTVTLELIALDTSIDSPVSHLNFGDMGIKSIEFEE